MVDVDVQLPPERPKSIGKRPLGLEWRSSYWFTTLVVGSGIAIDLMVYSIIIPVIPFQLEALEYKDVSSLAGWLLFAYSGGLLLFTFPVAMLSERYNSRKWPLINGFVVLIGSQMMFMEAPNYAVMCVARFLQGVASAIVNVVGLALLCDAAPEHIVGQQLGLAMLGFSVGLALGPPIGGALYNTFGFRGPFIFGAIFALVDLVGRFLIIERDEALRYGYDPHTAAVLPGGSDDSKVPSVTNTLVDPETVLAAGSGTGMDGGAATVEGVKKVKPLSFIAVMVKLSRSPRAVAAGLISLMYGVLFSAQEPSLPLHLQAIWGLTPGKVGLVFIAAVVPTVFSMPLSGWLADRHGTGIIAVSFLVLTIPWIMVMTIEGSLALFIVAFGVSSFFYSGVMAPVTTELAIVSRNIEGVGYAHVHGVFNAAYGAGSTIGPVIGGQMYDHLRDGWQAIMHTVVGLLAFGALVSLFFMDEPTLFRRVCRLVVRSPNSDAESQKDAEPPGVQRAERDGSVKEENGKEKEEAGLAGVGGESEPRPLKEVEGEGGAVKEVERPAGTV